MLITEWQARFGSREHLRGDEVRELAELVAAYTPVGFTARVSPGARATLLDRGVSVSYTAELLPPGEDPDDPKRIKGVIERSFQTIDGHVRHDHFRLPLPFQNQGLGSDCVRRSIELYDQLALRTVALKAVTQGIYVWAMCGFDFMYPGPRLQVKQAAQSFANRLPLERPLDFSQVVFPWEIAGEEEPVTYRDVAEARGDFVEEDDLDADEREEEVAVGKAIMLSGSVQPWEGRLTLATNSPGRRMFDLYTAPDA